ncbi:hypothetical protein P6709_12315 [Jeotgalibacillus sp. ET6]|uniref:hypothetical protein n=1 Tax=Jeotgalibacillus sp. ET6 TaxID=3037260 RepID=UPI0024187057|nr:hypothetical protein [Jeotgalibacillus sp. ET6]MDG5472531.1 hypothetical protein [Jeotgalibacillus sp. ET6]
MFAKENKLFTGKMLTILLMAALSLIIAGCSITGAADSNEAAQPNAAADKNTKTIETVIEKVFNAPDETFRELNTAVMEAQKSLKDQEEFDAFMETPLYKDLEAYKEDEYAQHFTDNGYESFLSTGSAFSYSWYDGTFKMNPSDIEITQSENHSALYHFTFRVNYENEDGKTNNYLFEGKANIPQEGKIAEIGFEDKDGLQQEISGE